MYGGTSRCGFSRTLHVRAWPLSPRSQRTRHPDSVNPDEDDEAPSAAMTEW